MAKDAQGPEQPARTLEQGDIFFFRPKVEDEDPAGLDDVQRFYLVLRPRGGHPHRLMVLGQKQLPDPAEPGRDRYWGFVDKVAPQPQPIVDTLKATTYGTKTRGKRHQPAARPAGEGIYRIVRAGRSTYLVYALELPRRTGEVQDEFNIEPEAGYVMTVKNPERDRPGTPGAERDVQYTDDLRATFRGRRFGETEPTDLLDYEGAQFLLVGASMDVNNDVGVELRPEQEQPDNAELFRALHLDRSGHPLKPLLEDRWD